MCPVPATVVVQPELHVPSGASTPWGQGRYVRGGAHVESRQVAASKLHHVPLRILVNAERLRVGSDTLFLFTKHCMRLFSKHFASVPVTDVSYVCAHLHFGQCS